MVAIRGRAAIGYPHACLTNPFGPMLTHRTALVELDALFALLQRRAFAGVL
jgi:hypothetical protein